MSTKTFTFSAAVALIGSAVAAQFVRLLQDFEHDTKNGTDINFTYDSKRGEATDKAIQEAGFQIEFPLGANVIGVSNALATEIGILHAEEIVIRHHGNFVKVTWDSANRTAHIQFPKFANGAGIELVDKTEAAVVASEFRTSVRVTYDLEIPDSAKG